jgi:hypothetical protein
MKLLKERPWTGTCRGKGREGDLSRRGKDRSTMGSRKREELERSQEDGQK